MNLSHLARLFSANARGRGEEYAAAERVETVWADAKGIQAEVVGTQTYTVSVRLDDTELLLSCNCPFAAEHGTCKHIWAALLVADTRGLLAPVLARATSVFVDSAPPPPTKAAKPVPQSSQPRWARVLDSVRQRSHY